MSYNPITQSQMQWLNANGFNGTDDLIVPHIALPNNFAIANAVGIYSWFVKINRFNWDSTSLFNSSVRHPAFTVHQTPPPVNAAFTAGSGTLVAGTYYYRVTALTADGTQTLPSVETSLVLAATGGVNVNWGAVTGATGYNVYGRSTGAELLIATLGNVTTYLDDGSITPAGAMPTSNSTGEREIYAPKYTACLLDANGNPSPTGIYAGSRPFVQQMSNVNFDQARAYCAANNGNGITGHHLMTTAEWAALQIRAIAGNTQPYGNTNYGRDDRDPSITGRCYTPSAFGTSSDQSRWLTGSGGVKTSHNFNADGVYDLSGNVWKWLGGMRLMNGEIQILANNDGADSTVDQSAASTAWLAILDDGSLVAPGTAGALRISTAGNITKAVQTGSGAKTFESVTCESDVLTTCAGVALLKQLGLYPYTTGLNGDYFWWNLTGEFVAIRGGACNIGGTAGVSALNVLTGRGYSHWYIGFPLAFVQ